MWCIEVWYRGGSAWCLPRVVFALGVGLSAHFPPPYGQTVGGTHPTGMHTRLLLPLVSRISCVPMFAIAIPIHYTAENCIRNRNRKQIVDVNEPLHWSEC